MGNSRSVPGLWLRGLVFGLLVSGGCQRAQAAVEARFDGDHSSGRTVVRISGLESTDLSRLEAVGWASAGGSPVVTVRVAAAPSDAPPVAGRLVADRGDLIFIPQFGFDPGRAYRVEIDADLSAGAGPLTFALNLPTVVRQASTTFVTRILPTTDLWPENALRFYVEFSAPMSRTGGLEYVRLIDDAGEDVLDPFLPLDVEFWNPDHTRYTFFFDPGRVKRDILPNREMGRALVAGRTYALEVSSDWRDAQGQPLARDFRRTFTVGPADEDVVDPAAWTIEAPSARTRDALVVRFPAPLDFGLLGRTVGVRTIEGETPPGTVTVGTDERSWTFVPDQAWTAGRYQIVVLSILEDPSGNRVGRRFEMPGLSHPAETASPERTLLDVTVR